MSAHSCFNALLKSIDIFSFTVEHGTDSVPSFALAGKNRIHIFCAGFIYWICNIL